MNQPTATIYPPSQIHDVVTGDPDQPVWTRQDTIEVYGELNAHGGAICPPEHFMREHTAGPMLARLEPWCSCGWTRDRHTRRTGQGPLLADHLAEMASVGAGKPAA